MSKPLSDFVIQARLGTIHYLFGSGQKRDLTCWFLLDGRFLGCLSGLWASVEEFCLHHNYTLVRIETGSEDTISLLTLEGGDDIRKNWGLPSLLTPGEQSAIEDLRSRPRAARADDTSVSSLPWKYRHD